MVQWIWRQIAVSLPATWELLQFSTEYPQGRCAFADRYQFRFELTWSMVKGEPDYDRMVSDYISKLEREKRLADGERAKKAGWHGFHGIMNGERTSRFGRYFAPIGCLVECVFLWPEARDPELESAILSSIGAVPVDERGQQRWRAFGLDIRVPPGAAIEGCTAQPARTVFSFSNPKSGSQWTFERLGMTASWLRGSLEDWFRGTFGPDVRDLQVSRTTRDGRDVVQAEAGFKPSGLHLKHGRLQAEAWICPQDGRVYKVIARLRGRRTEEQVPAGQLLAAAPEFTPRWTA